MTRTDRTLPSYPLLGLLGLPRSQLATSRGKRGDCAILYCYRIGTRFGSCYYSTDTIAIIIITTTAIIITLSILIVIIFLAILL
jgi:hypothetical protein